MAHSAKSLTEKPTNSIEANSAKTAYDNYVAANAAKSAYRNNWIAEKLDRVNLTMPKGKKEKIKDAADKVGISLNAYINQAIDERMERDTENG